MDLDRHEEITEKREIALTEKYTKKAGHEIHITTNEQLTNMKLNVSL